MVKYYKSNLCLVGKTVIITGSNTGIGYATALDLAKRGGRIILACRNLEKANEAREKIVKETQNQNVVVRQIDLSSFKSVREFAANINATEPRLDVLINNGGVAFLGDKPTDEGLQLEMVTNHYSPFLLTHLLLGLLKKSAPSRVVCVGSSVASLSCFDPKDINKFPGSFTLYCRSKLCNIFFTQILAEKIEGSGITTYSLHPGAVGSDINRYSGPVDYVMKKIALTPEQGAQTSIYLTLEQDIEQYNGRHFENCKKIDDYRTARDRNKAKEIWQISEDTVHLKPEEKVEAILAN